MKPKASQHPKIDKDLRLTFGKYEGKTVNELLEISPTYLLWADDEVEGFNLLKKERALAEACADVDDDDASFDYDYDSPL